jgi:type I restriction enzyme M protein
MAWGGGRWLAGGYVNEVHRTVRVEAEPRRAGADSAALVQKLWNYCNVLRDDGLSYQDYIEQLTFLLFLKMADEQSRPPFHHRSIVPEGLDWASLVKRDGLDLEAQYLRILAELGSHPGTLGVVFRKAQNKIQDPAKLRRLIADLIDQQNWMSLDADVKGDAYEGLLAKNAEDVRTGAGQYFTPRVLIQALVEVMRPKPGERICDPACGTGGFLLHAYEHVVQTWGGRMDPEEKEFLRDRTLSGWEIVPVTARLCLMNLMLHGITGPDRDPPITVEDALSRSVDQKFQIVLTNPPFGKKSSYTIVADDGTSEKEDLTYLRDDFWATTANKQLNFLQHVHSILDMHGRAAIVLPDNVLFEGGAGETIRRRLLKECDVHTMLRLPTGIFYAGGIKANVLFFDRKPASETPWTSKLWIYDFRTNEHFTLKQNPLGPAHLADFIRCYNAGDRHRRQETERFHAFGYEELVARERATLDITWLQDESLEEAANLPEPEVIAAEIVDDLQAALAEFTTVADSLAVRAAAAGDKRGSTGGVG